MLIYKTIAMYFSKFLRTKTSKLLSLFLLLCICSNTVSSQPPDSAKQWNFITEIYLLFPYMDGETGIGNIITAPLDAKPGDIFSKLKFGGMLYVEVHNDKWAIISDMLYANLNQEVTPGKLINSGTVTAKQFIWEPSGLYRLTPYLEAGVGGRLNVMETGIDVRRNVIPSGTEQITESASKTWFDPILIARVTADIKDKWLFQIRGDLGGFGIGSDFTWQLQAYAGYRFSRLFQLSAGYKILSIDYDKGVDKERFIYNVDTFGPVIRLGFNF
jgi:hypothetical protein